MLGGVHLFTPISWIFPSRCQLCLDFVPAKSVGVSGASDACQCSGCPTSASCSSGQDRHLCGAGSSPDRRGHVWKQTRSRLLSIQNK